MQHYGGVNIAGLLALALAAIKIVFVLAADDRVNAMLQFVERDRRETLELDCLTQIIRRDFEAHPQNYLIKYGDSNPWAVNMANKLLRSIEGIPVHVGFFSQIAMLYNLHTRIVFADSAQTFSYLVEQARVKAINSDRVRYWIVLQPQGEAVDTPIADIMAGIFGVMYDMYMLNAYVALPTGDGGFKFYTYFPYTALDCGTTRPVLIHEYKRGMEIPDLAGLSHTKINMNLCPIKVATAHLPPFIMLNFSKSGLGVLSGIEGRLVKNIAMKMNFTIDIQMVNSSIRGMVYDNRTATGVYRSLKQRSTNLTVGECHCSPNVMRQITATRSYYQSNIHIVVKAGNPYSSFEVLFYPFEKYAWMLFVLSCVLHYTLVNLLWKFVRRLPKPFRRFMLAMWLILIFYHRILYEASCFNYLRDRPHKPLPKSIAEFYAQGYTVISDLSTKGYVKLLEGDAKHIIESNTEPEATLKLLKMLNGKYGALVKKEYFDYHMRNEPLDGGDLILLPDTLVVSLLCMYFPRFSHLVEFVDSGMSHLRSFGFINKFISDYLYRERVTYTTSNVNSLRTPKEQWAALNLNQMHGVFLLLGVFWIMAAGIFCAELLSTKLRALRSLLDKFQ